MTEKEKQELAEDHKVFDKLDQVFNLTEDSKFQEAEELLLDIYNSIPHPKENARMGNPVFSSLIGFYEKIGKIEKALPYALYETDYLKEKIKKEQTYNTSNFILTGKIYYILKDLDKAREYFQLAYKLDKKRVFQGSNPDFLKIALMKDKEFTEFKTSFIPNIETTILTEEQEIILDKYIEEGNEKMEEENYKRAIELFIKAIEILPVPKENWEAYTWLNASLGDAYFQIEKYDDALDVLNIAYKLFDSEPNPFVLLRLGQCYYQKKELKKATDYLLRTYMLEGEDIFNENEEYLKFLKSKVKL
jgi:tetratricopeptide (TPR) repeat protein